MKEKHALFTGSNRCILLQLTNLSVSFSSPLCCFCWEICPLSGYHALSEHLPPSMPIFRKQMGSEAVPLPLQTAESGTLKTHLHTVALPKKKPPTPGKAPTPHTHLTQGANLACFTCFISHTCLNVFFLSLVGGRVTQCDALLHRGGGSALSHTASQGIGGEDSARRMTPADALQSNILALTR